MDLLTIIDYSGTLVFAISGVLAGVDQKFDLFGVLILGFVTAIGGGMMRDLLIGNTPVTWMQNEIYIYIILSSVPICYLWKNTILKMKRGIFLFDTVGIGLGTIYGLQKTLGMGLSPEVAILMGVVSGVFGGVLRDILSNRTPLIFREEIYAFACLAGAILFLISNMFLTINISMSISVFSVIIIRILAIKRRWSLPFNP